MTKILLIYRRRQRGNQGLDDAQDFPKPLYPMLDDLRPNFLDPGVTPTHGY
jgi:hypothetical protein